MRHAKQHKRGSRGKAALFFLALYAFAVFSMLLPLRPTESVMEKRKLTEFPTFSVESLGNGEYTKGIDTWFADTFPPAGYLLPAQQLGAVLLRHQDRGNCGQFGAGR